MPDPYMANETQDVVAQATGILSLWMWPRAKGDGYLIALPVSAEADMHVADLWPLQSEPRYPRHRLGSYPADA